MKEIIHLCESYSNCSFYGRWRLPKDFILGEEILIAFSKKNGHAFLIAGKYEMHGHFIFLKTYKKLFTPKSPPPQLYVRLKGISQAQIRQVESYIEKNEGSRNTSCINYIIKTLNNGLGLEFDSHNLLKDEHLVSLCENIDTHGLSIKGKKLELEYYQQDDITFEQILISFKALHERFKMQLRTSQLIGLLTFRYPLNKVETKNIFFLGQNSNG